MAEKAVEARATAGKAHTTLRVLSGMRPTGPLHLGHLVGALARWKELQEDYECFFMVADWHALLSEYEHPEQLRQYSREVVADWLAVGIDPERSTLLVQSRVPEHLELQMVMGSLTPLGWLERNPTYKEQLREQTSRNLATYGFLGYPVLQAADILLYQAAKVPVGEDQLPHLELAREMVRRFHHLYGEDILTEPQALLSDTPRLSGIDGRKMSKTYENAIALSDDADTISQKVTNMFTDPKRVKRNDPGHPETCNLCQYYPVFAPERVEEVFEECRSAQRGCTNNKRELTQILVDVIAPIRQRRQELLETPGQVDTILDAGTAKARAVAQATMDRVREAVGLL